MKIEYSDSIARNKSWEGIFNITKLTPQVALNIPNAAEYEKIKQYLILQKKW